MASTKTPSLAQRLLWTLLPPAAFLFVGHRISLPGIAPMLRSEANHRHLSVFAIGLGPIVLAYALVGARRDRRSNPDTGNSTVDGLRTFVLRGEPILTTADVVKAEPGLQDHSGSPEFYVAVELGSEGAQRFADATGKWTNRRIAIVVDGMINSAPVCAPASRAVA